MGQLLFRDLISQEAKRNPASFYAQLRTQGPLVSIPDFQGLGKAWVVTTYEDANRILKDPRFVNDILKGAPDCKPSTPEGVKRKNELTWRRDLLTMDPPDHTRLRTLVSKTFTPHLVERMRPRIQQIADQLLDAVEERGEMDLIADFAFPLPITVIAEVLGVPVADREKIRHWTEILFHGTEPAVQASAIQEFINYIKALLAQKRGHPSNDLMSDLILVEERGDALSETELVSMIWILILGGHETTANLIGSGILALLQHPSQLHLLQTDPSLLPTAIEELLRFTSPVSTANVRWATEDVLLHTELIRKGEIVLIALVAANTDEHTFNDPAVLDLSRQVNKHLAFGKGVHACLGAPLARVEGHIAFATLLKRLPHLRLAIEPEHLQWISYLFLQGVRSLPVKF